MSIREYVPAPKKIDHTFAELVAGREVEFPTLARAVLNTRPAHNIEIEWTVASTKSSVLVRKNYMQIFRKPYKVPAAEGSMLSTETGPSQLLSAFLAQVEQTLEHGVPDVIKTSTYTVRTCGGYRHYLGRDLNDNDVLVLRPLREPFLWIHEWRFDPSTGAHEPLDLPMFEWLAELSLEVHPG